MQGSERRYMAAQGSGRGGRFLQYMRRNWIFYLFLLPAVLDVIIFRYAPMYGIQIAFRDYKVRRGISGSEWVGLEYFLQFIETPNFWQIMVNTLLLSFYNLLFGFPIPILLAVMINEIHRPMVKRVTQMLTYMPHFISMVAVVGLIQLILDRDSGIVNILLKALGDGAAELYRLARRVPQHLCGFGNLAACGLGYHHLSGRAVQCGHGFAGRGQD